MRSRTCAKAELSHTRHVTAADGVVKRMDVALANVGDELRPRVEAAISRDRQLGIRQHERTRRIADVRTDGLQASEGGPIAGAGGANQLLGELALVFEVDGSGRIRTGHGRPPSQSARVRIMG